MRKLGLQPVSGLVALLVLAFFFQGCSEPSSEPTQVAEPLADQQHDGSKLERNGEPKVHAHGDEKTSGHSKKPTASVPEKVTEVLKYVDEHKAPPRGYEGGRTFRNLEQSLPKKDARGQPITYQEWDVSPKTQGVNRGAERLVTGSDGSAYYTADHYRTFTKIR